GERLPLDGEGPVDREVASDADAERVGAGGELPGLRGAVDPLVHGGVALAGEDDLDALGAGVDGGDGEVDAGDHGRGGRHGELDLGPTAADAELLARGLMTVRAGVDHPRAALEEDGE